MAEAPSPKGFEIVYTDQVIDHVKAIDGRHHRTIAKAVAEQLVHQPLVETQNRKPLEEKPVSLDTDWELRCGRDNEFRVFYKADPEKRQVYIVAIGVKKRDRLYVAGEEFEL